MLRTLLGCLIVWLLVPGVSWAARGFGTTDGTATTDVIVTGHTDNNTLTSWCFDVWFTGGGGGGLGRIWTKNDSGAGDLRFIQNTGAAVWNLTVDWSTTGGSWNITPPSTAAWHYVCITYDGSATTNDPIVYVDGSSVTVTESSTPVGTLVTGAGAYYIGNRPDGTRNWNGRVAEFAIWEGTILSSGDVTTLYNSGARARADSITPAPTTYWKLCGTASPEPNDIVGGSTGTVTGALLQTHPFSNCATGSGGMLLRGVGN